MPKVLLASPMLQEYRGGYLNTLKNSGIEIVNPQLPRLMTESEIAKCIADVDAVVAGSEPYTPAVLDAARKLKVIARAGVGYDAVDLEAATRLGIAVTIAPGSNHHAVADFTMTLVLALCRRLLYFDRVVKDGRWERESTISPNGAMLGIVGFGRVGQAVAQRAKAFEMRVLASDPYASSEVAKATGVEVVPLERLLRESDFVSLNCLLAEETKKIINRSTLALMKPTAYLINTARGELVDEEALCEALKHNRVAGAGLDVFAAEPLPRDSPLRTFDNVILAPHIAGVDDVSLHRMTCMAAEAIIEVLRGAWPEQYVVNPKAKQHQR